MSKFKFLYNSFKAGELSPKFAGRTDLQDYYNGAETVQNGTVIREGGFRRREGFERVDADNVPGLGGTLITFTTSNGVSVIVLLTNATNPRNSITIYAPDGREITPTFSATVNTAWGVANPSAISPNSLGWHYVQFADHLILVHNTGVFPPVVITYSPAADTYYVDYYTEPTNLIGTVGVCGGDLNRSLRVPFQVDNISSVTMTASATSGAINITASAAFFGDISDGTTPDLREGQIIRENESSIDGYAILSDFTSTTVYTANSVVTFGGTVGSDDWALSAWCNLTGWPRSVSFYNGRLIFGGTEAEPGKIWSSVNGNIFLINQVRFEQTGLDASHAGYSGTAVATDAFDVSIGESKQGIIQWVMGGFDLEVGTLSGEWVVQAGDDSAFEVTTARPKQQTNVGSTNTQPVRAEESTFFISKDGRRVHRLFFNAEFRTYQTQDITFKNDTIVDHQTEDISGNFFQNNKFTWLHWQPGRKTLWATTALKALVATTIDREGGVTGWHRHIFGGAKTDNALNGAGLLGVGSVPPRSGLKDDLYIYFLGLDSLFAIAKMAPEYVETSLLSGSTGEGKAVFADDSRWIHRLHVVDVTNASVGVTTDAADVDSGVHIVVQTAGTALVAEVTSILFRADRASDLGGTHFLIKAAGDSTSYYVWFDVDNGSADPAPGGTGIEVDISEDDTIDVVAAAALTAIDAIADFGAASPTTRSFWPGFAHLDTQTVKILAGGFAHPDKTVVSNAVTTDTSVAEAVIGMAYKSRLKLFDLEAGGDFGTALGSVKRIDRAHIKFYRSLGAEFGLDGQTLEEVVLRPGDLGMDDDLILFTGEKRVELRAGPDEVNKIVIESDSPFPLTVLAIALRGVTYE